MNQWQFVICVTFANHIPPGSCYIAQDGTPTMMLSNAARFHTFPGAKHFAETNHIIFNRHTRIGVEEFPVLDEQGWESFDNNFMKTDPGAELNSEASDNCDLLHRPASDGTT